MDAVGTPGLAAVFFVVAIVYSMAGFGGGSTYLAVLALSGLPHGRIAPVALSCNLLVAGTAAWSYVGRGHWKPSLVMPFMVLSVPAAYWGGRSDVSSRMFAVLLGLSLIAAALRVFLSVARSTLRPAPGPRLVWATGLPVGAVIGAVSGMIGIGGGIFLSPILILLGWADAKVAGCAAAVFIVVNSLAGLIGQSTKQPLDWAGHLPLMVAAWAGGWIGSRLGAAYLTNTVLGRVLAALMLTVATKVLLEVL